MEKIDSVADAELTAWAREEVTRRRKQAVAEVCPAVLRLLLLAGDCGPSDLKIDLENRVLTVGFQGVELPADFDARIDALFHSALAIDCEQAQVGAVRDGRLRGVFWDGREVKRGERAHPGRDVEVELICRFRPLKSQVISHFGDKEILDKMAPELERRASFYPREIRLNGLLWTWPLDFSSVRECSFTSYTLGTAMDVQCGFAVAHPWAHGCRFFVADGGTVVDLYARSGEDSNGALGNFCHIPALSPTVERRLSFFKKDGESGIDVSIPRTWGRHTCFPGGEKYLLSSRPVVTSGIPPKKLQMRPLRAHQVYLKEARDAEAVQIVPIRRGIALDTLRLNRKPGGLLALVECPDDLETGPDGLKLTEGDALTQWIEGVLLEFETRHKLVDS